MKEIRWSLLKNGELKQKRGITFEELLGSRLAYQHYADLKEYHLELFAARG